MLWLIRTLDYWSDQRLEAWRLFDTFTCFNTILSPNNRYYAAVALHSHLCATSLSEGIAGSSLVLPPTVKEWATHTHTLLLTTLQVYVYSFHPFFFISHLSPCRLLPFHLFTLGPSYPVLLPLLMLLAYLNQIPHIFNTCFEKKSLVFSVRILTKHILPTCSTPRLEQRSQGMTSLK